MYICQFKKCKKEPYTFYGIGQRYERKINMTLNHFIIILIYIHKIYIRIMTNTNPNISHYI